MTGIMARLDRWKTWFLQDPAGFIDGLPQPWRTMGLAELTVAAWASSPLHAGLRPHWRLAMAEGGLALVVAFDGEGGFLAAAETGPGAPGLLRLRAEPARIVAHGYGGAGAGAVQLAPWNGWTAYRAARRAGAAWPVALQAAWPPSGPRYLTGGAGPFAPPTAEAYRSWIARNPPPPVEAVDAEGPMFAVSIGSGMEGVAMPSLQAQTWTRWRVTGADTPPVVGETALALGPDDRLAPHALAALAAAFADAGVDAVYADEDRLDADGLRCDPVFKTAFDPDRMAMQDHVGAAVARRVGAAGGAVRHLPQVLWHRQAAPTWTVSPAVLAPASRPKVLAVVPTRDRFELLRGCMAGLLERTDWPGLEVCVVDNGSVEPRTVALLAELGARPGVQVLRIEGPFDYPGLNNAAVRGADAELVVFLNDDTWVIDPDWLAPMAALAGRPEIGAVGAKLFYPDGRIQHAGVTLGLGALGAAGHGFRGAPGDLDGPQRMLKVTRRVSAVTGACLMVGREKFEAVGGFDPAFQVAFNDVDLCLRLAARGWACLWTPQASLVHLEGASRGRDASPERTARLEAEAARLRDRWGSMLINDPYYHPALSLVGERFALGERLRSSQAR